MLSPPPRVVLFGELLMRLTTPGHSRFAQAQALEIAYTGGEANAGALLVACGVDAVLVAAVPDNDLGAACLYGMRRYGMQTQFVQRRGPRLGTLFVELGAAQRPSRVIYDRAGSSFALLKPGDIPWHDILAEADWFHFTGTAPALSQDLLELTLEGCRAAKQLGKRVSCDLNYRSTLWSIDEARAAMTRIAPYLDLLVANEEHARLLLAAPPAEFRSDDRPFECNAYRNSVQWLQSAYGIADVALTIRAGADADETVFAAVVGGADELRMSPVYQIRVVDRIGAGDAFTGALIYATLQAWGLQERATFAAAAACLKHSIPGDVCVATIEEIQSLAAHGASGRIVR